MKGTYSTALRFALLIGIIGLAGCAGGPGTGEPAVTEGSAYTADTPGQQLLLEQAQKRRSTESATQTPDVPLSDSASPTPCKGWPGFDRGCPESAK